MVDKPNIAPKLHNEIFDHLFSDKADTQIKDLYAIVEFARKHRIFDYEPMNERKNKDEVKYQPKENLYRLILCPSHIYKYYFTIFLCSYPRSNTTLGPKKSFILAMM